MSAPVAVLDIGSNSVRFAVLTRGDDGAFFVPDGRKQLCTTRLGKGLDTTGRLSAEAMEATVAACRAFATWFMARQPWSAREKSTSSCDSAAPAASAAMPRNNFFILSLLILLSRAADYSTFPYLLVNVLTCDVRQTTCATTFRHYDVRVLIRACRTS